MTVYTHHRTGRTIRSRVYAWGQIHRVVTMYEAGEAWAAIVDASRVHYEMARYIVRRLGISRPLAAQVRRAASRAHGRDFAELEAESVRLRRARVTVEEIADTLAVSRRSVGRWLKRNRVRVKRLTRWDNPRHARPVQPADPGPGTTLSPEMWREAQRVAEIAAATGRADHSLPEPVEELVPYVLERIHRAARRYDPAAPNANWGGFAYHAGLNAVRDYARAKGRKKRSHLLLAGDLVDESGRHSDHRIEELA